MCGPARHVDFGAASAAGAGASGGGRTDDLWWKKALLDLLKKQKSGSKPKGKVPNALKDSKKIYSQAKKRIQKAITQKKKLETKAAQAKIRSLPKGQRAAARKQFKAAQKAKYDKLKKQMPTTRGLTLPTINTLVKRMKTMRI